MKKITVDEILKSPFSYGGMLVHVVYKTYWRNMGNEVRQDKAYFTGRITFISTSWIYISNGISEIHVPVGYFIRIDQAEEPPLVHILAKENIELRCKIAELKKLLEK